MTSENFLRPPTTVNVDFDAGLESPLASFEVTHEVEDAINDPLATDPLTRNTRAWNKENRTKAVTDTSRDIDGVIQSFNEELETLSRSIDELTTSRSQSRAAGREHDPSFVEAITPRHRTGTGGGAAYSNYSTSRRVGSSSADRPATSTSAAYQTPSDPPPSSASKLSPLRFSTNSTPQRGSTVRKSLGRDTFDVSGRSYRSPYVSQNDPPRPVETPATTGVSSRNNVSSSAGNNNHGTRRAESTAAAAAAATVNDWEVTLDRMQTTMEQQEMKIKELERENRELKRLLTQQDTSGGRQPPSPHHQYSRYDDAPRRQQQQRSHCNNAESTNRTFPSTQLSAPPRDEDDAVPSRRFDIVREQEYVDDFTPGTKFVTELSRLMKIEDGHNAPLSVILDKHWDRLKYHLRDETY